MSSAADGLLVLCRTQVLTLPCGHAFHAKCIHRWLAFTIWQPRTCPVCKRDALRDGSLCCKGLVAGAGRACCAPRGKKVEGWMDEEATRRHELGVPDNADTDRDSSGSSGSSNSSSSSSNTNSSANSSGSGRRGRSGRNGSRSRSERVVSSTRSGGGVEAGRSTESDVEAGRSDGIALEPERSSNAASNVASSVASIAVMQNESVGESGGPSRVPAHTAGRTVLV